MCKFSWVYGTDQILEKKCAKTGINQTRSEIYACYTKTGKNMFLNVHVKYWNKANIFRKYGMCNQPLSEHLADIDQIKGDSLLPLQNEIARHYKNGFSGTNIICM